MFIDPVSRFRVQAPLGAPCNRRSGNMPLLVELEFYLGGEL